MRDIAAQTGVSIATVSRVLNGRDHVAPQTRDLVCAVAEQLRAAPARAAAGAVYLRCPYLLTDYFGLIVSAVAETLALHGRAVLLDAGTAGQQASGPAPAQFSDVAPRHEQWRLSCDAADDGHPSRPRLASSVSGRRRAQ